MSPPPERKGAGKKTNTERWIQNQEKSMGGTKTKRTARNRVLLPWLLFSCPVIPVLRLFTAVPVLSSMRLDLRGFLSVPCKTILVQNIDFPMKRGPFISSPHNQRTRMNEEKPKLQRIQTNPKKTGIDDTKECPLVSYAAISRKTSCQQGTLDRGRASTKSPPP